MKTKILKEPLFQFALIGIGLFILFSYVNTEVGENEIIIDDYDLQALSAKYELQWKRQPTPQELKGLLDAYIKEEIMYREALAMNLDHNDEIIRRRMAQKVQFLTQDVAESSVPTDQELQNYMDENPDKYQSEKIVSFEQLFFNPETRLDAQSDARAALNLPVPLGDEYPLKASMQRNALSRVSAELGSEFVAAIDNLETSPEWQGPVKSGFGFHLVKLTEVIESKPFKLQEVRDLVETDYQFDLRNQIEKNLYNSLLEKYKVTLNIDENQFPDKPAVN